MNTVVTVKLKTISPLAYIPKYKSGSGAGALIRSIENKMLEPNVPRVVKTGICIELPAGYEAQIRTNPEVVRETGLIVLDSPSTISADDRGEITVLMVNMSKRAIEIHMGDTIALLVLSSVFTARFQTVKMLTPKSV